MEWTGEFGALLEAKKRLAFIVPLSLLPIMMLLYSLFNSVRHSLLALSGIPFAVAGGILRLYVAGLNASVSAAVGFIVGGMLLSPICSLLVIPTFARLVMPEIRATGAVRAVEPAEP